MAENEGMEGKDLAKDKKVEFEAKIMQVVENLKNGHTSISTEGLEVSNYDGQYVLKMRGIEFAIIRENSNDSYSFEYNTKNYKELIETLQSEGIELEQLGLPDLKEVAIDQEEKEQREDEEGQEQEENDDEERDEERDDKEKPELGEDKEEEVDEKKEEIAKQYGVNSSQVIHIAKNKKITRENFGQIAKWSNDYDDIFIVPGEDEFSRKFIGVNEGKQEEIENAQNNPIRGKNPDVTVKRIDGDKITDVRPLAMYQLDDKSSIAIVRDQYGQPEALYCREQAGDKKAFWGSVIPEASSKNIYQQDTKTRNFMDSKYNSSHDLDNKAEALERQEDLEKRGLPSKGEGVQREEIEGTNKQNIEHNIDDIVEDLMRRDGIMDKATVPDNYYDNKAKKVLSMMETNENISYEDAVQRVDEENTREEGGRAQGDAPTDPRRG